MARKTKTLIGKGRILEEVMTSPLDPEEGGEDHLAGHPEGRLTTTMTEEATTTATTTTTDDHPHYHQTTAPEARR